MDWGMKNRMSRIINPETGRCVMLAVDHGYFQGPTTGLRNLGKTVNPLLPYADAVMITAGALKNWIDPTMNKPVVLRVSGGNSMELPDELSDEIITTNMEDAIRMNASAVTCSVYVGSPHQRQTIENLAKIVNEGNKYGIPVLAVTAVGRRLSQEGGKDAKDMVRNERYLGLASRICVEVGAHMVKTYYCEEFEKVVEACGNVPVVIAGGKKIDEIDALKMAKNAVSAGARGVDMGRNIFQSDCPVGMIKATRAIVHDNATVDHAYEIYLEEKARSSGR
ncbi:MAG: 3-hydroxy-5-phosphonooxypentane-2,4-dione thiolase [Candidatus Brockarchaeota archaeon]|nr:3-hydroxy-5-phosphonooxypentane-2,4-dione thiolase [Candidatus Brockarchaeota archaeon]